MQRVTVLDVTWSRRALAILFYKMPERNCITKISEEKVKCFQRGVTYYYGDSLPDKCKFLFLVEKVRNYGFIYIFHLSVAYVTYLSILTKLGQFFY